MSAATTAPAGWRWAVIDACTIAKRDVLHWRRQPGQLLFALVFPVIIVLMFGYLLGGAMSVPGGGPYIDFLMPGMFAMTMLFGMAETAMAVATDLSRGVTDRFRSLPMSPSAVVAGRCLADMLKSVLVLVPMLACGLLVGWRWQASLAEALAAVGLLLLLRFAFIWVGVYLGLVLKGEEAMTALQTLEFPVGFLSNAFVATTTMPMWLGVVAEHNPLSATVAATRELFANPTGGAESWVAHHPVLMALVWPLVLVAVFFPLSVRRYRRLSR